MKPLKFVIGYILSSFVSVAFASSLGSIRLGGLIGLGQAGARGENETRLEGPIAFSAFIDYSLDSRFTLGAEHSRSFASGTSSIGFTGVVGKWYFYTPQPQWLYNEDSEIRSSQIVQKYFVPYLGVASGFAQASFPVDGAKASVLVVGPYLSFKMGLEYPLFGKVGCRSEFSYAANIAGTGFAEMVHVLFGFYYFL